MYLIGMWATTRDMLWQVGIKQDTADHIATMQ